MRNLRLVARRYQPASLIITSNRSFIDWGEIFGDQVLATAILDRLPDHSSTINIEGESFRLKEEHRAGMLSHEAPENTAAPARDSAKSSGGGAPWLPQRKQQSWRAREIKGSLNEGHPHRRKSGNLVWRRQPGAARIGG